MPREETSFEGFAARRQHARERHPRTSVLDGFNQSSEVPNLFVTDGPR